MGRGRGRGDVGQGGRGHVGRGRVGEATDHLVWGQGTHEASKSSTTGAAVTAGAAARAVRPSPWWRQLLREEDHHQCREEIQRLSCLRYSKLQSEVIFQREAQDTSGEWLQLFFFFFSQARRQLKGTQKRRNKKAQMKMCFSNDMLLILQKSFSVYGSR